ncbi:MAG: NAD(P)/FAD-dependent oxidoreductase [Moheibacter sp.]
MKKVEYIIIGQGVAGSCFALKLIQENKSFIIIDQNTNKASSVAVGIYNPVVLKRFSLIWNAVEQLKLMKDYFDSFEELLGEKYLYKLPTYRIIRDDNEIHAWKKKVEKPELIPFLNSKIHSETLSNFSTPFGYGEVMQTGRIRLRKYLDDFRNYLINNNQYLDESFDFSQLSVTDDNVQYHNIKANKIIFCEGFGIKQNPYFNYLPIIGVKGEVLKIKTNEKIPPAIWKAHNFLMPTTDNYAYAASTYDRDDLTPTPTEKGKQEILTHLKTFYKDSFKVVSHYAGVRPTVIDRRPIIGSHSIYKNLFILNGMGTRGTLLAPQMTEYLFNSIEKKIEIDKEANIRRFDYLFNS